MAVLKDADTVHFMAIQYSRVQWCSTAPAAEYVIINMLYMCTLPLKISRDVDLLISYQKRFSWSPAFYSL